MIHTASNFSAAIIIELIIEHIVESISIITLSISN